MRKWRLVLGAPQGAAPETAQAGVRAQKLSRAAAGARAAEGARRVGLLRNAGGPRSLFRFGKRPAEKGLLLLGRGMVLEGECYRQPLSLCG